MTQAEQVLALLREMGETGITDLVALKELRVRRLAARVWELRAAGHDIETIPHVTVFGARVARYVLHESPTFTPTTGTQEALF